MCSLYIEQIVGKWYGRATITHVVCIKPFIILFPFLCSQNFPHDMCQYSIQLQFADSWLVLIERKSIYKLHFDNMCMYYTYTKTHLLCERVCVLQGTVRHGMGVFNKINDAMVVYSMECTMHMYMHIRYYIYTNGQHIILMQLIPCYKLISF